MTGSGRFEQGDGVGAVLPEVVFTLISQGGARQGSRTRVSQQVNQSEHGKEGAGGDFEMMEQREPGDWLARGVRQGGIKHVPWAESGR